MKTTTTPAALRLLAALFFFLLLAPMVAGEEASTTSSNWKDQISAVDKIANVGGGNGTKGNPILIATAKELAYFAQQVNEGKAIKYGSGSGTAQIEPNDNHGTAGGFLGYYFALSADIDLEDHYWTPIGTEDKPFKAYFDGRGHCVSRLKVNVKEKVKDNVYEKSDPAYAGLFGNAFEGTIQNLGVRLAKEGVQATGENGFAFAGGIAGQARFINCCYVEGPGLVKAVSSGIDASANSGSYAGGIVGGLLENLTHCYATVAVKAVSDSKSHAGGITGNASGYKKELSYTYATGAVEATGTSQNNYAGGICGYAQFLTIGNNLALNDFIKGNEKWSNRIVGKMMESVTSNSNYASPEMLVNGKTVSDNQVDKENGANTWLSIFEDDLIPDPNDQKNGWATSWTFTSGNLPQLNGLNSTPLKANLYLPSRLYIVSPTGGTLTVTDDAGNPLADGSAVLSGTRLKLANTEEANYYFSEYLSGSDKGSLKSYDSNSITMTDDDLYLSATFTLYPKLHIVSSTGGTLTVTDKDGKELPDGSYIRPGTVLTLANTEEANYYFSEYLFGSDKGSLKSYGSNSITMTDADLYLSATFTYQEPEPPYVPPTPVYYSVYLPQVEGATTDPGSGKYEVEARDSFRFFLKIDSAYSESQPVVTTDRGETLKPRSSDGAYLVNDVCSDVEVFIDGIFKNPPPVANEAISTDALVPQIWSEGSMLCIRMPEALPSAPVRIFTMDGRLYASFDSTPGLNRRQLPTGIYIVRVGDTACKVIVK